MAMYFLTDGKNYVMENELKPGEYLITTYSVKAKEFTYKNAKGILSRKGKKYNKFRNFYLEEVESGRTENVNLKKKGNGGLFIGSHDCVFDNTIPDKILKEVNSIEKIAAWDEKELNDYRECLLNELAKKDCVITDIYHALLEYIDTHDGKRPQAHKMAKVFYVYLETYIERRKLKLCLRYVDVMLVATKNNYTLSKLKNELKQAENKKYKGRTEYYEKIKNILCA